MGIIDKRDQLPEHETLEYPRRPRSDIDTVVIHHTTRDPTPIQVARYHISADPSRDKEEWPGMAYTFGALGDGTALRFLDYEQMGYHAGREMNPHSVGVVLFGDFTDAPPPPAQIEATRQIIERIEEELGRKLKIIGHREVAGASTECPGNTWPQWREEIMPEEQVQEQPNQLIPVYVQCQGHGYHDWVVEHAKALGGAQLINPQYGEYQKFTRAGIPTIGRIVHNGDPDKELVYNGASGADDWWNYWFWPQAQRCPEIDIWRGPNEPAVYDAQDARALDAFTARLCDIFQANGKRLVGVEFSTGHPEIDLWKYFGQSLRRLAETNGYLGRHSYSVEQPWFDPDDIWHAFRLEQDVTAIKDAGHPVPPIILSETGIDRGGDPQNDGWRARGVEPKEYVELLWRFLSDLKRRVPEVVIASAFLHLSTGWPSFNIDKGTSELLIANRPQPDLLLPSDETAEDLPTLLQKARWWQEEAIRRMEDGDREYMEAILYDLIQEDGLLYRAEQLVAEQDDS